MTPWLDAKILMVDDVSVNLDLVEGLLRRQGYLNVRRLTDSREALGVFLEFQPDLVLLDLLMPHRDGYAVLGDLREAMRAWPVPAGVIIITADVTARHRCWLLGEGNFLPKPIVDLPDFWGRVASELEIRRLGLALHRLREAHA